MRRIGSLSGRWLAAAIVTGICQAASAQYAPYAQQPPQQSLPQQMLPQQRPGQPSMQGYPQAGYAPQPGYAPQQSVVAQRMPGYQQVGYPVAAPSAMQVSAPMQSQPAMPPASGYAMGGGYSPTPAYAQPPAGAMPTMNYPDYRLAQRSDDALSLTPPTESVAPGAMTGPAPGAASLSPTPMNDYSMGQQGYPGYQGAPGGYGGQPGMGMDQYGTACPTGQCGTSAYGYGYGACDTGCASPDYAGKMGCLFKGGGCNYWFGGVYGLLMDRDNADKIPVAMSNSMPAASYPPSSSVVLTNRSADIGFQPGVEVRLGRTFGCAPIGGCGYSDPCGGGCGAPCAPRWGLEAVYWNIFQESYTAQYVNPDYTTTRLNIMRSLAGLQIDMGSGYRPANHYWDYAPPVTDYTTGGLDQLVVTRVAVYDQFQAQNLEVNLLRLSCCGGGYGGTSYGAAAGYNACGGSSCGAGGFGGGCGADPCAGGCGGCQSCGCAPRFMCTGVCGVRYMQFDETFRIDADTYNVDTSTAGYVNYNSIVRNNFIGPQIGCNGMYRIGCKWGFHLNSAVGIFANDINVRQYLVTPSGNNAYISNNNPFNSSADKTDVSMIGELRLGASYQATCRARLYGGWRVIGVTGFAQASDQMPAQFIDGAQLTNYVNSNGSLILHGLQAGVEFNF